MPRPNKCSRAGSLKIFGGSSHPEMTQLIARKVGARLGEVVLGKFSNRESQVELKECVRGQDIYIVQTAGGKTPNDHLMELLFLVNALRLAAASNIIVITPFFFYSKGDHKDGYRVPITSKLVGTMLRKSGATHLMLLDPHTPQVEGFFDLVVDTLSVEPLFCEWIRHNIAGWEHCIVVSPDEGGAKRSASLANDLVLDFAIISNRNKKLEQESVHLCPYRKRKKKKSICSDTESSRSAHRHLEANELMTQSSRSSCLDPNDPPALGDADREKSEEPLMSESEARAEADMPQLDKLNLNGDQPESDMSVQALAHSTQETQTEECTTKFFHDNLCSIHEDKSPKSSKPIAHLSSSVQGRHVIVIDDMIDTGHTIELALETLQRGGARSVTILVTHGVFSRGAFKMLESYGDFIRALVVTNSISQKRHIENGRMKNKFHVLDVSGLIAEFVRRHHYCESVSVLGRFMPIRDNFSGGGRRRQYPAKAEKKVPEVIPALVVADKGPADPAMAEKDEVFRAIEAAAGSAVEDRLDDEDESQSVDEDDDDDDVDETASDAGIEIDEEERRKILDPSEQQKLRKGFRMASICWDD